MNNTSDEINLESKQNIICHVAKVKFAMSTHYLADLIQNQLFFLSVSSSLLSIIYFSNFMVGVDNSSCLRKSVMFVQLQLRTMKR